jgi:2-C-methyl-D-erythritol 4-phosphate cytidylyltransferase
MGRIAAIIPAAGLGTRMGAETPKQFLELDGMPLIIFTLKRLAACPAITDFSVATRADDVVALQDKVARAGLGRPARVVHGGDTRQQSVANALAQVDPSTEIVLVHDAVRPFVTREQIERVIAAARARGAAILGIPAIDTVKEVKRASLPADVALISATIPRERIVLAQTPQAFSYALLRDAFLKAQEDDVSASDEAAAVERFGHEVFVVLGSERNLKITRPSDMDLARFYLEQERLTVKGVTFVPNQQPRMGMSITARTILFWLLMVALAVVLWQMASKDRSGAPAGSSSTISYSDFMDQVDKSNVRSVKILESSSTAEVEGQLREPPQNFRVTVPKEVIPTLTDRLRKQGASIDVSTAKGADSRSTIINLLLIIVVVALWIFSMSRRRGGPKRNPPASPATPTVPTNRPLG